ncbi:MAG: hypothetical protein V1799_07410 [bacterium]
MNTDTNTRNYLELFEAASNLAELEIRKMEWVGDVEKCISAALELHFLEQAFSYPDFPEATDAMKRSILCKAESIHAKRYTLLGLMEYVGCFAPIGVGIFITPSAKKVLFLGNSLMGLPSTQMLESVGPEDEPEKCFYFYDPQYSVITVTMPATVSDKMKEFFETTLPRELPFGGDDIAIELNFVYE